MRRLALGSVLAAMLALGIASAHAEECGAPADLKDGWTTVDPKTARLDPAALCEIGPRFDEWKEADLHAVVVIRDGKLAYERYFKREDEILGRSIGVVAFDAATKHDDRSISKTVTSLVVGIAVDRGWIKDIDAPVFSFFPEYADLRTPEKDKITLRHLLTMSAGFVWDESLPYTDPANSERPMDDAADPYRYVFSQPMAHEPGKYYEYCGCSATLLGAVLKKVAGKPFDVLAKELLFDPLGIGDLEWGHAAWGQWGHFDNGGVMPHAALRLRPRDLAKIGQMVLDRGMWQGTRIVAENWIAQSTAPQINGSGVYFYGYQWWLGRSLVAKREVDWAAAVGLGGQRLFVVPDKRLVVAVNAGLYNKPLQSIVPNVVLNQYVLAALTD
jgi:CubicO group peptidase (beta-lactamase class C family)